MGEDWKKLEGQVVNNRLPIQQLLGSTSYSAVFQAQSPNPQAKNVAIKFLRSSGNADSRVSLFNRTSKLSHPNLLRLMPGGRCQLAGMDLIFVVMEYAEEDLGRALGHHPLNAEKTHQMLGLLLEALGYLHSNGFAHAHIKPSNILSVAKQLKLSSDSLLPLGEARSAHRAEDVYDAPEAGTTAVAASSDVWSLGATLVEVLTQRPVDRSPGDPVVPSMIPQPFYDIARQCLRRDPLLRWTIAQIAGCLDPAPVQVASAEKPASPQETAPVQATMSPENAEEGKPVPGPMVASQPGAGKAREVVSEAWQDIHYCWVVLCKNYFFHMRQNLFFRHRIPLAYTDPFSPVPTLDGPFEVRCNDCRRTFVYKPSDVRRYEGEVPKFTTHPLF